MTQCVRCLKRRKDGAVCAGCGSMMAVRRIPGVWVHWYLDINASTSYGPFFSRVAVGVAADAAYLSIVLQGATDDIAKE